MKRRNLLKGIGTASIVSFASVAAGEPDCVVYWEDPDCYLFEDDPYCPEKCCFCYRE